MALSRRTPWMLAASVALVLLLALNWQKLALSLAISSAPGRPSLLNDAQWGKPDTAIAFNHRFGSGSSEAALMQWLAANHFEIDRRSHVANLSVNGGVCGEKVAVTWTATNGTIDHNRAVVSEAGCL